MAQHSKQKESRRVFITGGARRLGRDIARHLRAGGNDVTVHYNTSVNEAENLKSEIGCSLFRADFAATPVDQLRTRLNEEVGSVDCLINNASSFQQKKWDQIEEGFWDNEISVNLKIPFFLTRHFGELMKKQGKGKIVNFADIAADRPYLKYLPYSISKAGIVSMTRAFARVLAPEVQVNAIAPGTIRFPDHYDETEKQKILNKIPARRSGTIEELLKTVDFLLSDVDYITGQIIVLDGGRSLTW